MEISVGEGQAAYANAMWKQELASNIPLPSKLYCSPLTRALKTCMITFDPIMDFKSLPIGRKLLIVEVRSRYARPPPIFTALNFIYAPPEILSTFGEKVDVEETLAEEDVLFKSDDRETYEHVAERVRAVLDRVFEEGNKDDLGLFYFIAICYSC